MYTPALLRLALVTCLAIPALVADVSHASGDYQIGPNDQLGIEVFGIEDLQLVVRVSSSGTISAPHVGRIYAAGLTGAELEDKIAKELVNRKLVRDPQVSVFVQEFNSQPIYILGAVNQPGQYMLSRSLSVVDAITMAGGLDPDKAGRYILIRRGNGRITPSGEDAPDDAVEPVVRIDVKRLLEEGDVAQDVALRGGDVVQVPTRKVEVFYVIGDVPRPGAFEIETGQEEFLLATGALGWAGGPTKTARLRGGMLIRNTDGGRQQIALNFKDILDGKAEDPHIEPNDILFVPGSKAKTLGHGLLTVLPGTLSGVAIWNSARN